MKNLFLFITGCLLLSLTANANNNYSNQDPFVFIENGVEYAVFNNGEFDFNIINKRKSSSSINVGNRKFNISFNTGGNYNPYIETNSYGEVTQIANTSIFYNRVGQVNRIGNITINYNRRGFISNIGSLNVYYNSYGTINYCRGNINRYNINYRPRYNSYTRQNTRRVAINNRYNANRKIVVNNRNRVVKKTYKNYKYTSNSNKRSNNKNTTKSYKNNGSKYNKNSKQNNKSYAKNNSQQKQQARTNTNSYRRSSNRSYASN